MQNNHVLRRELTLRLLLLHVHKLFLDSGISGSKCDMRYEIHTIISEFENVLHSFSSSVFYRKTLLPLTSQIEIPRTTSDNYNG